jgi:hypothetical protein
MGGAGPATKLHEPARAQAHFIERCRLPEPKGGLRSPMPDEEVLRRLLALNRERSGDAGA